MAQHLHELVANALAGDPDEVALEFVNVPVRWGYLKVVAAQLDAVLTQAGIGPGGRVAFVPRNRPSFAAAVLSLIAAQRSIVMVYAFQSPQAIASDLQRIGCAAVIADAQDWTEEVLAAVLPGGLAISLDADLAAETPVRVPRGDPSSVPANIITSDEEPVVEMLTSGTTGAPKRAPMLYRVIERAVIANSILDAGAAGGGKGEPGTVNFPLSNISGIYSYLPMAVVRRLVALLEKFDVDLWLAFIARHRPKVAVLPPAGLRMMLDRKVPREALDGIEYISVGTSAVDIDTHRAFEKTYGVSVLLAYGATEFCGAATAMTAEQHREFGEAKLGSVGRASGQNEIRIVDPGDHHVLPAGEVGIIEVKVPFLGDNFIRTTDLGVLDEDGFLFHRGRVDGVIVRGGFKIMPGPVERVINGFPGVAASCVVGVSERRLGQVPVAVVEPIAGVEGLSASGLEAHLRAALPATNIPVDFHFVDALPRTPSMKVDLKEVRAMAERLAQEKAGMVAN